MLIYTQTGTTTVCIILKTSYHISTKKYNKKKRNKFKRSSPNVALYVNKRCYRYKKINN